MAASPARLLRGALTRSVRRGLAALGYEIRPIEPPDPAPPARPPASANASLGPYVENPEVGARNLAVKLARVATGGPFEWPDILALNQTVAGMIGPARRIVELGGGTGAFAIEAAADPGRLIVSSEFDREASGWAQQHRARPNVRYVAGPVPPEAGPFDLLVAIEIIEHIADYRGFLQAAIALAPRAIFTTPNRNREGGRTNGPPAYDQHVREWTAGELYWVLRCFYRDVRLFAMADPYVPHAVPIQIGDALSPLIAECAEPLP